MEIYNTKEKIYIDDQGYCVSRVCKLSIEIWNKEIHNYHFAGYMPFPWEEYKEKVKEYLGITIPEEYADIYNTIKDGNLVKDERTMQCTR